MTTEELREIDRRVAVAIGGTLKGWPMGKGPFDWWRPGHLPVPLPHFTTDPAASDLVRIEIERRGWSWAQFGRCRPSTTNAYDTITLEQDETDDGFSEEDGWAASVFRGPDRDANRWARSRFSTCSYHHALCLAFLAAVEAEATQ